MAETKDKTEGRPKGGPQFIILLVIVLGPALLVGQLFGAGAAAVVGGFVALFTLISSMGGPLRVNLERFAFVGPLVAFGAVAPRLLAEVSLLAGIALAIVVVFVAGLLPLLGARYNSTGLGLGMGTLLGYAMPIGAATPLQLLASAAAGLVVTLLLLVVMGIADPHGPTRSVVAGLFDDDNRDFGAAFDTWISDKSPRWLGRALIAAGQYRLARRVASSVKGSDAVLETAAARAHLIAESVRAKKVPTELDPGAEAVGVCPAESAMFAALDAAGAASLDRDATTTTMPAGVRSRFSIGSVRAAFGHGSIQLRHAIRSTVAVIVAFGVSLFLEHGDPLLPTLLLTTFGLVQVSWRATLTRARDRFFGVIAGGVIVLLILLVLPPAFLFPISMVSLGVGIWFITARPAIGTAGLIVMSVGLNSQLRDLDPFAVAIEYVVLTLVAVVVGGVLGFLVVPSWRPPALTVRANSAIDQVAMALRSLADTSGPSEQRLRAVTDAQSASQQLLPDHEKLTDEQVRQLEAFRISLQDLLVTAIFTVTSSPTSAATDLVDAADALESPKATPAEAPLELLAQDVAGQRVALEVAMRA